MWIENANGTLFNTADYRCIYGQYDGKRHIIRAVMCNGSTIDLASYLNKETQKLALQDLADGIAYGKNLCCLPISMEKWEAEHEKQ